MVTWQAHLLGLPEAVAELYQYFVHPYFSGIKLPTASSFPIINLHLHTA